MPNASVGAPPVREISVASSTDWAAAVSASGLIVKPRLVTNSEADGRVAAGGAERASSSRSRGPGR